MFDHAAIKRTLSIHDRAYQLFLWLNRGFKSRKISDKAMAPVLTSASAARAWITGNLASLPADARPENHELDAFVQNFISFINTSFKVGKLGLNVRKPGEGAKETALQLKKIYLQSLGVELGREVSSEEVQAIANASPDASEALTLATYAHEIMRRQSFQSQGEGVQALWRELVGDANDSLPRFSSKRKKFEMTADGVLAAEKTLIDFLRKSQNG